MNAPQIPIVYKRTCNPTPPVHQDMTKKTMFFYEFVLSTEVKCKIRGWFLSSALPLINIYVCAKFNFNPFCTFKNMTWTHIHYEKNKWLRGDNTVSIHGRITVFKHSTSPYCQLSINQLSFLSYLTRYGPDRQPL